MSKKKIVCVLLTAVLVFGLACALSGCGRKNKNEVDVFVYGDYIDPQVIKDFEKETGIKAVVDTFDTSEELYPVIKNRAGVYDVICPSDYMAQRMIEEGLLQPIDFSKVPNYKYIGKTYKDIASRFYDPGNQYTVTYQWGIAGIMYNTKRVPKGSVTGWKDLWDKKYSGKIVMMDSLRDTLGIALKAQGKSINTKKEADLKSASDYLIKQKPLVYKYANDSVRDLMIGNSADLGVIWNGEVLYSRDLNKNLDFVIPEEGTELFFDVWCIPKNAFHVSNAQKWIDYMCRPEVAYKNFEYLTYSTPNEGARKLMPKELRNSPYLFPSQEVLDRCEVLKDMGPETDDMYSKYWKIFKSAN